MDAFGWSTQPPAAPTIDALLAAFLGTSFDQLHSDVGGDGTVSSDAYGLDLPSSSTQHDLSLLRCHDGVTVPSDASSAAFHLDSVGFLPVPAIAGAHDGGRLLDRFAFPDVPEDPAQAAGSNTAFSGYSTTTGGGNISSGESNTYGGHDTEVASSSRPVVLPSPSKRKLLDKYPAALGASATTTDQEAEERWGTKRAAATTTTITFGQSGAGAGGRGYEPDTEAIAQVKEMIYRAAAMRPVNLGPSSTGAEPSAAAAPDQKPRRRKNVRISSDPQTVAARLRREKVSERLRALQRLVPGGSKMDTASMLDEAASYLRFLKSQLAALETLDGGSGGRSLPLQRYNMGGRLNPSRAGANGAVQLAFGRDGIAGYVKSNRNMQL